MTKVAIYCRLSEEDKNKKGLEDDSESIRNQKAMLCEYVYKHNWELYDIYSDEDYAGTDRERPQFKKLLEDAENKKFDIVLCKTQSRFTRELELVEKYIHGLFPIWGIRFISIVDNADTENKGNKKARQINGLVNEWYLEDMSENIKSVLTSKRKKGEHIGSFALYGYKKDPNRKGHLVIDEEAAKIVKEIFTLFLKGYGKTSIARILNDRGVPSPSRYKWLHGSKYKGTSKQGSAIWHYSVISSMLVNEFYIGNMVQGKSESISYKTQKRAKLPKNEWYIVKGTHRPIIEKEMWDTVQELVKAKAKPFKVGKVGIFARKVQCANCGYSLKSFVGRGRYYLRCSGKILAKNSCIGSSIAVKMLENIVLDELKQMYNELINKEQLDQNVNLVDNLQQQKKEILNEITLYERKISELSKATKDLYLDKSKGIISEIEYRTFSQEFVKDKERLADLVNELKEELVIINEKSSKKFDRRRIITKYANIDKLNHEIVQELIGHICIGKRKIGTKEPPVEIFWNF